MFCPQCRAEYRLGFTRCSDCDVELVEELSEPDENSDTGPDGSRWRTIKRVWSGKDEGRCISLCEQLRRVGVPFKVNQRTRQYLLGVERHYEIGMPSEFFDDARQVILKGRRGDALRE